MKPRTKFRRTDFFADDWLAGAAELTLEQEGAYIRVCALIYSKGQPIPDNERWLAGACRVSIRKWRALRKHLLDIGKITVQDGLIHQHRCEYELEKAAKRARKCAENGAKGGRKSAEIREISAKPLETHDTAEANAQATLKHRARGSNDQRPTTIASGSKEPAPQSGAVVNPEAVLFDQCLAYLTAHAVKEKHARSVIGSWRKDYGAGAVIEVMSEASRQSVSEPVAWIVKALQSRHGSPEHREVAPL